MLGRGQGGRIKMTGMNIKRRLGHPGERTLSAETLQTDICADRNLQIMSALHYSLVCSLLIVLLSPG